MWSLGWRYRNTASNCCWGFRFWCQVFVKTIYFEVYWKFQEIVKYKNFMFKINIAVMVNLMGKRNSENLKQIILNQRRLHNFLGNTMQQANVQIFRAMIFSHFHCFQKIQFSKFCSTTKHNSLDVLTLKIRSISEY